MSYNVEVGPTYSDNVDHNMTLVCGCSEVCGEELICVEVQQGLW